MPSCFLYGNLLIGVFAQLLLLDPLLNNVFHQQGDAPFLALCYFCENFFGFLIGTKRDVFVLFHINHPYTLYTFSLDKAMNTL